MFGKILIANRGEIACRVMRTAGRMGIGTVAVYSEADRGAPHVAMADEAICIGPPEAARSYLDMERIIEAARQSGAEAIHPGYGFLSENAAFARACEEAGIAFIGPNARAIEVMGDKLRSKRCAAQAGVSTVPGVDGEIEDVEAALAAARSIGYPVMIKASAGGGGKGMRIARDDGEVREGFEAARSEAVSSFGDGRILMEKFIEDPRHVEIQVMGDKHGNIIWLGERECSIQRRNQKVVEEAPSPLLDEETRRAMGEQAVALARAVGYDSAGTVEFVCGQDRSFYFLEMNTRLQVEHPVTEMTTGLDLVELMIRAAAGEELGVAQEDVRRDGWAVETRIYAEDPLRGFLPSIGRLRRYQPPRGGEDGGARVRVDSGVAEGGEISMHYDPMIAKLITWGPDRQAAIEAHADALDAFHIDGPGHNIPFLAAIMANRRWREGRLSTAFIDEEFPDGFAGVEADWETLARLAMAALAMDHAENLRRLPGMDEGPRRRVAWLEDERRGMAATVEGDGRKMRIRLDDGTEAELAQQWRPGEAAWRGEMDGKPVTMQVRRRPNGYLLSHRGVSREMRVYSPFEAGMAALMPVRKAPDTSRLLICPMPGKVLSVAVGEGDKVAPGDRLCVIEAMKMENILRAERPAVVSRVSIRAGDTVSAEQVLMEFEADQTQ